jgi:hypothetical protein
VSHLLVVRHEEKMTVEEDKFERVDLDLLPSLAALLSSESRVR